MQREMLPQCEGAGVWHDLSDDAAGAAARERIRQRDVDLGVVGEASRERAIDAGAVARNDVVPLLRSRHRADDVRPVPHGQIGRVHQQATLLLGDDGKRRDRARRERFRNAALVRRILPGRAPVSPILENHEDAISLPLEPHDLIVGARPTVDPDGVRPEPRGLRDEQQRANGIARELEEELAGLRVHVDRQKPVTSLESGSFRADGGRRGAHLCRGDQWGDRQRDDKGCPHNLFDGRYCHVFYGSTVR